MKTKLLLSSFCLFLGSVFIVNFAQEKKENEVFTTVKCNKPGFLPSSNYPLYPEVFFSTLTCPCKTITGKISDENGNPLSGVFVTIPGTETGVMTNARGLYAIEVPDLPRVKLMFALTKYVTRELTTDRFVCNVTLYPEPQKR